MINDGTEMQKSFDATQGDLTSRQERERAYYNQYSQRMRDSKVNLAAIAGKEERPWNPYWHLFGVVKSLYKPGARLLDFGCGWGDNTVIFAKIGYQVEGFDIAESNLEVARELAKKAGVSERVNFSVQRAEHLRYADRNFDVVAGIDILHHVDIPYAITECRRVLREGGVAVFVEPFFVPIFDRLRNTRLVKRLWPNDSSFERHITADERKLSRRDLDVITGTFQKHRVERFRVLSRLAVILNGNIAKLEKLDYKLRFLPGFGRLAGTIVLTLENNNHI